MCWFFCYCFLIIFNTTVHYISNESEDISLLNPICNLIGKIIKFSWIHWRAAHSGFSSHGDNTRAAVSDRVNQTIEALLTFFISLIIKNIIIVY